MRVCFNCGRDLEDRARFCDVCGMPQPTPEPARRPLVSYPPPTRVPQAPETGGGRVNVPRLAFFLLLIGSAIGFGIGAALFSWQQTTTTQRLTVTSIVTSTQQITLTQTSLLTMTQTISSISPPTVTQTISSTSSTTTLGGFILSGLSLNLVAFLMIPLFVVIIHKVGRYPEPVSKSERPGRMIADALLIWGIYMAAILVLLVFLPLMQAMMTGSNPVIFLATQLAITFIPVLLLPVLYVRRRDRWTAADFGLTGKIIGWKTVVIGIVFGVLYSLLGVFLVSPAPLTNLTTAALMLLSVYSPTFLEELLARGIIQGKMERALGGSMKPILLTSLLFVLWRVPSIFSGFNLYGAQIVSVLLVAMNLVGAYLGGGVLLGILYRKTRSLLPGIIVRYLMDFGPAIFAWLLLILAQIGISFR